MKDLERYFGRYIELIDETEEIFVGVVELYVNQDNSDTGEAYIAVFRTKGSGVGYYFYESQIKSLKILTEEEYNKALKAIKDR